MAIIHCGQIILLVLLRVVSVQEPEKEFATIPFLIMVEETAVNLVHQHRQLSVTHARVLFKGAIPLGLTFQNALFHVVVGVHVIELEIAPTPNLNMVVRIVLTLVHQWRQWSAVKDLALFQGAIARGLTFQNALFHVAVGAYVIELEIAPTPNLNTVVRIVLTLVYQWGQWCVVKDLALFQGAIARGLTFQNALFHVAVRAYVIELEIAPTPNLNTVVRIVLTLVDQWRQ